MKNILFSLSLLSTSAFLQSCTTFDPYTGEQKTTKTAVGAGIGASVGAVVAYLDNKGDDSRKRNQRILAAAAGVPRLVAVLVITWISKKLSCASSCVALA